MLTRRQLLMAWAASAFGLAFRSESHAQPANEPSPDIYYDSDGLIVHKGMEGGDTAQREGWYWFGVWIRANVLNDPWTTPRKLTFGEVINLLEPNKDGIFYRHPKLAPWNNPFDKDWGFSRDQMIPLVAAMGVWGALDPLHRLWNALPQDTLGGTKHTFNGSWQGAYYTGDIVGPMVINLFRRAWGEDPMKAGDGNGLAGEHELAGNALLRIPPALSDRDNTGDDLNLIVMLLMSILRFPSGENNAAANAYAEKRLMSYGSFIGAYQQQFGVNLLDSGPLAAGVKQQLDAGIGNGWTTDASRVYGAVRWYHRQGMGANPKLAELYGPIVRAYLEQ